MTRRVLVAGRGRAHAGKVNEVRDFVGTLAVVLTCFAQRGWSK